MSGSKPLLSNELRHRMEDFAREQNRDPVDVMEEAMNRYLARQRLARFAEKHGAAGAQPRYIRRRCAQDCPRSSARKRNPRALSA